MARPARGTTFQVSYSGVGKMIRSPWMQAEMRRRAEKVKASAEVAAPVETGDYKKSFTVSSGARGGARRDRAYGRVTNSSGHAIYVEVGTSTIPARHVLRNALRAAGD